MQRKRSRLAPRVQRPAVTTYRPVQLRIPETPRNGWEVAGKTMVIGGAVLLLIGALSGPS